MSNGNNRSAQFDAAQLWCRVPNLEVFSLPANERRAAMTIRSSLEALRKYVREFYYALRLFDYCEEIGPAWQREVSRTQTNWSDEHPLEEYIMLSGSWKWIAANHAMLSIYHFGRAREGIRATQKDTPRLRSLINAAHQKRAGRLFRIAFPYFIQLRHAIAHEEETRNTPRAEKRHSLKLGGPWFQSTLHGRHYEATWEGDLVSAEISWEALDGLCSIRNIEYAAFHGAVETLKAEYDASQL